MGWFLPFLSRIDRRYIKYIGKIPYAPFLKIWKPNQPFFIKNCPTFLLMLSHLRVIVRQIIIWIFVQTYLLRGQNLYDPTTIMSKYTTRLAQLLECSNNVSLLVQIQNKYQTCYNSTLYFSWLPSLLVPKLYFCGNSCMISMSKIGSINQLDCLSFHMFSVLSNN